MRDKFPTFVIWASTVIVCLLISCSGKVLLGIRTSSGNHKIPIESTDFFELPSRKHNTLIFTHIDSKLGTKKAIFALSVIDKYLVCVYAEPQGFARAVRFEDPEDMYDQTGGFLYIKRSFNSASGSSAGITPSFHMIQLASLSILIETLGECNRMNNVDVMLRVHLPKFSLLKGIETDFKGDVLAQLAFAGLIPHPTFYRKNSEIFTSHLDFCSRSRSTPEFDNKESSPSPPSKSDSTGDDNARLGPAGIDKVGVWKRSTSDFHRIHSTWFFAVEHRNRVFIFDAVRLKIVGFCKRTAGNEFYYSLFESDDSLNGISPEVLPGIGRVYLELNPGIYRMFDIRVETQSGVHSLRLLTRQCAYQRQDERGDVLDCGEQGKKESHIRVPEYTLRVCSQIRAYGSDSGVILALVNPRRKDFLHCDKNTGKTILYNDDLLYGEEHNPDGVWRLTQQITAMVHNILYIKMSDWKGLKIYESEDNSGNFVLVSHPTCSYSYHSSTGENISCTRLNKYAENCGRLTTYATRKNRVFIKSSRFNDKIEIVDCQGYSESILYWKSRKSNSQYFIRGGASVEIVNPTYESFETVAEKSKRWLVTQSANSIFRDDSEFEMDRTCRVITSVSWMVIDVISKRKTEFYFRAASGSPKLHFATCEVSEIEKKAFLKVISLHKYPSHSKVKIFSIWGPILAKISSEDDVKALAVKSLLKKGEMKPLWWILISVGCVALLCMIAGYLYFKMPRMF